MYPPTWLELVLPNLHMENIVLRDDRSMRLDKSSLIGKEEAGLLSLFFWGLEGRQKVG